MDARENVVNFVPGLASYNRLEVGEDGKVAHDRAKGKKPIVLGLDFATELLYKVKPTARLEKRNSRWEFGIFVGGKEEEWGGMDCSQRQDFKCQVCKEDTRGTQVGGGLLFLG